MAHGDPPAREELQIGSGPSRPRRWRWPIIVLCCLVVAGAAGLWLHRNQAPASNPLPGPSPAGSPSGRPAPRGTPPPRSEATADLSFLGAESDYTLFVRSEDGISRVAPRTGRLVMTTLSPWQHGSTLGYLVPMPMP